MSYPQADHNPTFLGIPLEIRINIYQQVFFDAKVFRKTKYELLPDTKDSWSTNRCKDCERRPCTCASDAFNGQGECEAMAYGVLTPKGADILFVCHQTYREARDYLEPWATFSIDWQLHDLGQATKLHEKLLSMRQVEVHFEELPIMITQSDCGDDYLEVFSHRQGQYYEQHLDDYYENLDELLQVLEVHHETLKLGHGNFKHYFNWNVRVYDNDFDGVDYTLRMIKANFTQPKIRFWHRVDLTVKGRIFCKHAPRVFVVGFRPVEESLLTMSSRSSAAIYIRSESRN